MPGDSLTPPNISRAEFARNLAESGLIDLVVLMPDSDPSAPDGAAAAQELVAAGKLTPYQADAVLGGRFENLRVGNYEILDRIGAGGMGTVFKARHRRMKRIVALKLLSQEVASSEMFLNRFQREIETIAQLCHPNIVMAFDADEDEAGPFLVMEFVDGRDLATEVATNGPLPVAAAVDRIIQAARGLEFAHKRGIVHRDIKPGNILRDVSGVVKVADLGLARFRDPSAGVGDGTSLTQAGVVFGTVEYMSPEQAVDSGTVDQRADVYSLGCTLHFLLVGRSPYPGQSFMAVMLNHRDAPIPVLCDTRSDIPPTLDAIFRRMVAKKAEDRYPSMTALIEDLERAERISDWDESAHAPRPPSPSGTYDCTICFGPQAESLRDDDFDVGPAASATPAAQPPRIAGLTAVVVEPSRTQAGIIRSYLQQLGITAIHMSVSGREAIETTKRVGANVLISSLHLSDMTGVQLGAELRADPNCADVGFVLATSATDSVMTADLPRGPRTVVMLKPYDLEQLAQFIASVL